MGGRQDRCGVRAGGPHLSGRPDRAHGPRLRCAAWPDHGAVPAGPARQCRVARRRRVRVSGRPRRRVPGPAHRRGSDPTASTGEHRVRRLHIGLDGHAEGCGRHAPRAGGVHRGTTRTVRYHGRVPHPALRVSELRRVDSRTAHGDRGVRRDGRGTDHGLRWRRPGCGARIRTGDSCFRHARGARLRRSERSAGPEGRRGRRRGVVAGTRGPVDRRARNVQRVRADGGHRRVQHLRSLGPERADHRRRPDSRRHHLRARPAAAPGSRRRHWRALHRRSRRRAGVPRPSGPDGGAVRRESVRQGRADVPHGRSRPVGGRRPHAADRIPRPHRLPGQDPRLPHRTRRDRHGPVRAPARELRRDTRPHRTVRHHATGLVRPARPWCHRHRGGAHRVRGARAAVAYGAGGDRRAGRGAADAPGQARPQGASGARLRNQGVPRAVDPGGRDRREHVCRRAGCGPGRCRRRLLRTRRQLAHRDPGGLPPRGRVADHRAGAHDLRGVDRRGACRSGRTPRRRWRSSAAGPHGTPRPDPTVARAAAHVVPQPIRHGIGGRQHPGGDPVEWRLGHHCAPGGRDGCNGTARIPAYGVPRFDRRPVPAGARGGADSARPDARARLPGRAARQVVRARVGRVRRHHRGSAARPALRDRRQRVCARPGGPPHLCRRVVDGSARSRRDGRVRGAFVLGSSGLARPAGAVRRLRAVAATGPRRRERPRLADRPPTRLLEDDPRRPAGPARPAERPPPPRRRLLCRRQRAVHDRRGPAHRAEHRRPGEWRHAVHGHARRTGGVAGAAVGQRRHRNRHPGGRPRRGRAGRPGRHVRQHPGTANAHRAGRVLRRPACARARGGPRRVRPGGRAVRATGRGPQPGAVAGTPSAVPGHALVPEPRPDHSGATGTVGERGRVRRPRGEVRSAADPHRVDRRCGLSGRHGGRADVCDGPVRRVHRAGVRRAVPAGSAHRGRCPGHRRRRGAHPRPLRARAGGAELERD
ncbi:basic proline-rich protein precursor [Rhodococcus aetherivorans]|uniref:Basic proline-rich protein n=1 Tax=Rhodococcus aetherivorans TaxID=191292 RepID=A0ABQ0YU63_9NOCA|nr:basic proline-rich protein precursor [Rhodococcus aetherivorans]